MYQIAFYEVPRSQKIGFGEVVVIRDLVKMGPKCISFSSYDADAIGPVLGGMGVDTLWYPILEHFINF